MKKILITHSYFYPLDAKQWKFKQPYPPLGTLLAAAVLRQQGFEVTFCDANLEAGPENIIRRIKQEKPDYLVLYDDGFNYLTKMCLTTMRKAALKMIAAGRSVQSTVVVSSSDATDHCPLYLDAGADYVIRGEAEQTLQQLFTHLEDGLPADAVQGIVFRDGEKTVTTPGRPVLRELDKLPMPAWDLVAMEKYRNIWLRHHGYFSLNIATTRGCPFKCNWCAKPIYGNRYNSRSPANVVGEIAHLTERYRPDHFWMCDDIFGLKPGWVQQFDQLLREKNLRIRYKIQSRVDLLLEADTIRALADSGAETVWVGAESGSQKILDAMDKGTTVEQIREATRLLKAAGIRVAFFLQFGYPGETQADIEATKVMVKELMPDEIGISISYPLPGTRFYERVKGELGVKHNWIDSNDLDMLFRGSFHSEYYRQLHRYIHSFYRTYRGFRSIGTMIRSPEKSTYRDLRNALSTLFFAPNAAYLSMRLKSLQKV